MIKLVVTGVYITFLLSCISGKQIFKDELRIIDQDYYDIYYNDSLDFSLSYHYGYNLYDESRQLKKIKIPKKLLLLLKKTRQEQLFAGESRFRYFTKTTAIIYDNSDVTKFSNALLKKIENRFQPDTVSLLLYQKIKEDMDVKIGRVFNLLKYQFRNKKHSFYVVEYHIALDIGVLRLIWLTDLKNPLHEGEDEEKEWLVKKNLEMNAQNNFITFQDSLKSNYSKLLNSPFMYVFTTFQSSGYNYLHTIRDLEKREKSYYDTIDNSFLKSTFYQVLITYYSYVGEYQKVLEYEAKDMEEPKQVIDTNALEGLHPEDAIDYILKRSQTEQVVMLNEAHHLPYCRSLATKLLKGLYKQGFRYLAAETLSNWDTLLNQRKYPIQGSGYYSSEPLYGDLIRRALKLGFEVIPYENTIPCPPDGRQKGKYFCFNHRNKNQAQNLAAILEKDPKAKIFVYAGYAHIYEKGRPNVRYMAMAFKDLTGIDPLTIDQTKMREKWNRKFENPYYVWITDKYSIEKPTVLLSDHMVWKEPKINVDIQVIHPRTSYSQSIPTWLLERGDENYSLQLNDKNYKGKLLQIFIAEEFESDKNPIPLLNVILHDEKNKINLKLEGQESYIVVITDELKNRLYYDKFILN